MKIALIAHDSKKELMTQFCIAYCGILSKHSLCATGTTGKRVVAFYTQHDVDLWEDCCARAITAAGGTNEDKTALTKSNIATRIMAGTEILDDAEFPEAGRTLLVSAKVYKLIKLSDEFMSLQTLGVKSVGKGHVGEFDGMPVRKVSKKRMPDGVNFLIVHKSAGTAPKKLHDTKIHQDPPGLSGNLREGRMYYDCFVLERRAEGVYADKEA